MGRPKIRILYLKFPRMETYDPGKQVQLGVLARSLLLINVKLALSIIVILVLRLSIS